MDASRALLLATVIFAASTFVQPTKAAPCTTSSTCSAGVVYSGNDPFPGAINGSPSLAKFEWNGTTFINDKAEDGTAATGGLSYIDDFTFSVTTFKDGVEPIAGTWSYNPDSGQLLPTILAIKAGNDFILMFIAGLAEGTWSTAALGNKEVSHLSFYDGAGGPSQVPLPAAVWFFGSAIAGFAGVSRWRKRQQKAEPLAA